MFGLSFDDVPLHRAGFRTEVGRLEATVDIELDTQPRELALPDDFSAAQ